MLKSFAKTPIDFGYTRPTAQQINFLQEKKQCVEMVSQQGVIIGNDYFQMNLPGSIPKVYCREAVYIKLMELLDVLLPNYGIYCFDIFRTKETQRYLFDNFKKKIHQKHPELNADALEIEVRKYVSHPDEPTRFTAPPHNTGGAIDLAFVDLATKQKLFYGSEIDLSESISATDFFEKDFDETLGLTKEQWLEARKNRRILFNSMKSLGFTNYPTEWWHYDLGDGMWAEEINHKPIYDSMEP